MSFSRRTFLALTAAAGTHTVMGRSGPLVQPRHHLQRPGFKVVIMATNWGYHGSWDAFARRISEAGYDGAELWYPQDRDERDKIVSAFKHYGLSIGYLVGGSAADFSKHLQQFTTGLEGAAAQKPLYINCHSGRDHFTFEQNREFIALTTRVSKASGVPVYHETHRSRLLYAAPVARQFIEALPDLRLTLDISHWCNVHESLLQDQAGTIATALSRVDHIHARIGHAEGPQVNDPRAPEWKDAVDAHFAWWDAVVAQKRAAGDMLTFLTEFGPVDYMPALPYTRQPVADQWEINTYMLQTLRARYTL